MRGTQWILLLLSLCGITEALITLRNRTGYFQTPNYPDTYDYGSEQETWQLQLMPYETVRFIRDGPFFSVYYPDDFIIKVNSSEHKNLAREPVEDGETWTTIISDNGPTNVELAWNRRSDYGYGNGLRGRYEITCNELHPDPNKNACVNGGMCRVARCTDKDPEPVLCVCPKNFTGSRCETGVQYTSETHLLTRLDGIIQTPDYPLIYPSGKSITWEVSISDDEMFTLVNEGNSTAHFEVPQDFFTIHVNRSRFMELSSSNVGSGEILASIPGPADIKVHFSSDGGIGGSGLKTRYRIFCQQNSTVEGENYCKNEGVCRLNMQESPPKRKSCTCPPAFTGERCEKLSIDCPLQCGSEASCGWKTNRFTCRCDKPGFFHNGSACTDINECLKEPCSPPYTCKNTIGSFECVCDASLGYQHLKYPNNKTECVYSGCVPPWFQSPTKNKCYLLSGKIDPEHNASDVCKKHDASLAKFDDIEAVSIGIQASSPLVFFQAPMDTEDKLSSRNWGPGFPTNLKEEIAVLYPHQWTLGNCSLEKRFICTTEFRFCPNSWYKVAGKCFHAHEYPMRFDQAQEKCQLLALGGVLATWDDFTAAALGPDFWVREHGEGKAHFWVKTSSACLPPKTNKATTEDDGYDVVQGAWKQFQMLNTLSTQFVFQHKGILNNSSQEDWVTAVNKNTNARMDCPDVPKLPPGECSFIFPNKWGDLKREICQKLIQNLPSTIGYEQNVLVLCERPSSFFLKLNEDVESELDSSSEIDYEVADVKAIISGVELGLRITPRKGNNAE